MSEWLSIIKRHLFGMHYYRVLLVYRDKRDAEIFSMTTTIGVTNQCDIDDHRKMKKVAGPVYRHAPSRSMLRNGRWIFEPQCYLGRWR